MLIYKIPFPNAKAILTGLKKNNVMRLKKSNFYKKILASREVGVAHYIPLSHLVAPTIFETKQGYLGSVIALQGYYTELLETKEINWLQQQLTKIFTKTTKGLAFYVTHCHGLQQDKIEAEFSNQFAAQFNKEYQSLLARKHLYSNTLYLTVILKQSTAVNQTFIDKLSFRKHKQIMQAWRENQIKTLQEGTRQLLTDLNEYQPRLLAIDKNKSEIARFFSLLINAEERDFYLAEYDLAEYLPAKQILFGHKSCHFADQVSSNDKFGAVISIKQYGSQTQATCFYELLKQDFEFISTHTFMPINNSKAYELINKQYQHLSAVNDPGLTQIHELQHAKDKLAAGNIVFGYHHNTLLVLADKLEQLDDYVAEILSIYKRFNLVAVRETLNMEAAFWAQLPGNFAYIARQALITSENFADLCPLHNIYKGYVNGNHLGNAVMPLPSASRTLFYFNFHEQSSGHSQDLSKGHTTIIAPSNAGKTTLMCVLDLQAKKYQGLSVFFDRDRGCELYVRACGGDYFTICPGTTLAFNPLQLSDTPINRDFLEKWLQTLFHVVKPVNEASFINQLTKAINYNFTLPLEQRCLSNLYRFLGMEAVLHGGLRPWLRVDNHISHPGSLAYLFDNAYDKLSFTKDTIGFDMTHLLDNEDHNVLVPVMLYLFHRIELMADGRLIGIYLDEGWQYLESSYWQQKMRSYLPTLRKKNIYIVFTTQSPGTVARSCLRDELIQGSATNIFLPNPKAEPEQYIEGFKLTNQEFEFVAQTAINNRLFLVKQGLNKAICKLDLQGLEHYLPIFSSNQASVNLLDKIRHDVGDEAAQWMPHFLKQIGHL
ncbi:MAG: VirB4 family type IV secretion/conjugal transfer ATPase [Gammaproteobacteria bacterium]